MHIYARYRGSFAYKIITVEYLTVKDYNKHKVKKGGL